MTPAERIELLRLTKPNTDNPNMTLWIQRATELETWVNRGGPSQADPHKPVPVRVPEARNNQQSPGPARK